MKDWFFGLEPRERLFVGVGAVAVAIAIIWGLLLSPLYGASATTASRIEAKRGTLTFLRGAAVAGHPPGAVRAFLDRFPTIWPDNTTLEIYASQFARLRATNSLPGPHDLWIAATALQFDIPLVTRNTAQFARIEGIRLESY